MGGAMSGDAGVVGHVLGGGGVEAQLALLGVLLDGRAGLILW
jgi:hypothetical protein